MKNGKLLLCLATVCLFAGFVQADNVYSYGTDYPDNFVYDWTEGVTGTEQQESYTTLAKGDILWAYCTGYDNTAWMTAGYRWVAPEGETIKSITFELIGQNGGTSGVLSWYSALTVPTAEKPLEDGYVKGEWLWDNKGAGGVGTYTVDVESFGTASSFDLGFVAGSSYPNFYSKFDNVVITTVPEPASMCLLALGGVVGLIKRRK